MVQVKLGHKLYRLTMLRLLSPSSLSPTINRDLDDRDDLAEPDFGVEFDDLVFFLLVFFGFVGIFVGGKLLNLAVDVCLPKARSKSVTSYKKITWISNSQGVLYMPSTNIEHTTLRVNLKFYEYSHVEVFDHILYI